MKDVYIRTFYTLIKERERDTGFQLPQSVEHYCVYLLAERVEKKNIIPDPSFAEKYLMMYQDPRLEEFKQFGDDCLFFTSILPEYGKRKGLSKNYFCDLGAASYDTCNTLSQDSLYKQLSHCFYELQQFLEATIKNRPIESLFKLDL